MFTPKGNKVPRFDSSHARRGLRWFPTFRYYIGLIDTQDDGDEICGGTPTQLSLQK